DVRGDLLRVLPCLVVRSLQHRPAVTGLGGNNLSHHRIVQDMVYQRAAVRKVRTDGRGTPLPEMHAEDARRLPVRKLRLRPILDDCAQRQWLAETQQRVSAVPYRRKKVTGAADDLPAFETQELE